MGRLRTTGYVGDPRIKPHYGSVEVNWGHPLTQNLRGCWLFNETIGSPRNLAKQRNVGTLTGGVAWTPSPRGPVLKFDGSSGKVTFTQYPSTVTGPFTWLVDVKPSGSGEKEIIDAGQPGLTFGAIGATLLFWDGSFFTSSALPDEWVRVAAVRDGSNFKSLYLNGRLDASGAGTGQALLTTLSIGALVSGGREFPGSIGHLFIYDAALSASLVAWAGAEPYAGLSPIVRRRYFIFTPAAAPGGTTIFRQEHVGQGIGRGVFVGR